MNTINVFNEGVLLLISMSLPFFIEVSLPKVVFNLVGWILVSLLALTVLFNMGLLISVKTFEIFVKCCRKKKKPNEQEILEKRMGKHESKALMSLPKNSESDMKAFSSK